MSLDIPEDADFLCDKAAMFRDTIKGTFCIVGLCTSRINSTKNSAFFHIVYSDVLFLRIGTDYFPNTVKPLVLRTRSEF